MGKGLLTLPVRKLQELERNEALGDGMVRGGQGEVPVAAAAGYNCSPWVPFPTEGVGEAAGREGGVWATLSQLTPVPDPTPDPDHCTTLDPLEVMIPVAAPDKVEPFATVKEGGGLARRAKGLGEAACSWCW